MTLELYKQVALTRDVPEARLYEGDVAVLVDFIDHPSGGEQGARSWKCSTSSASRLMW